MNKDIKLTKVEVRHLLYLVASNENEGRYWGNKEQYWKRTERIENKLLNQLDKLEDKS